MAMIDSRNDAEHGLALSATLSGTTKAEGAWIDLRGWASVTFTVSTGTVTDAGDAGGFTFQLEESDTTADADATAVDDADLIGSESDLAVTADGDDNTFVGSIGYTGTSRYVRMTATGTTGTDAAVTVHAIKRHGSVMGEASIDAGTAAT